MSNAFFLEAAIAQINQALSDDREGFRPEIEKVVRALTAAELYRLTIDKRTHEDFFPYMWAFHVSWSFEAAWAGLIIDPPTTPEDIEAAKELEVPDNFDPNIPLKQLVKWAPQDHLDRVYGGVA